MKTELPNVKRKIRMFEERHREWEEKMINSSGVDLSDLF